MLSLNLDRVGIKLSSTIVGLCLGLIINPNSSIAQVVSDNTTDTQISVTENISTITGGTKTGQNLFHSFEQFSVNNGAIAHFNHGLNIERIFSRVTGGSISQIDGLIRANGNADLFLLNPAGIIFGANGSLDIGGSFVATTAESLVFEDGIEFSATTEKDRPLLTINAPIGLQYGVNTGEIAILPNSDRSSPSGLNIKPGNVLALVGGDIDITRNDLNAFIALPERLTETRVSA